MWPSIHQRAVWFTTMNTSATPRKPSRNASRPAAESAILLEPPREHARRRDLDDDGVGRAQRRLLRILRAFLVKQVAPATEARPALDQPRAALDHHAAQRAPGIRVGIDDDGHPGVLGDVLHLAGVVAGGDEQLAAAERMAHGHHVGDAGGAGGGHPADALPLHELGELAGESGRRALATAGHQASPLSLGAGPPQPGVGRAPALETADAPWLDRPARP